MTPIDYALTIPTAYTREELEFFWAKLNERKPDGIVEVGVEYGCTASLLFRYAQDHGTDLTFIDSYIQHPQLSLPSFINNVVLQYTHVPFTFYKMRSKLTPFVEAQFLHIDASHSYEDTQHELWFAKKHNSYVLLHDFDRKGPNGEDIYEGVGRAAREHFRREPDEIVGTCALYRS